MFVAPLEKKDLKINNGSLANREKIRTLNFAQLVRFSILKAGLLTQPKTTRFSFVIRLGYNGIFFAMLKTNPEHRSPYLFKIIIGAYNEGKPNTLGFVAVCKTCNLRRMCIVGR